MMHHLVEHRTLFVPKAIPNGPDLARLSDRRQTLRWVNNKLVEELVDSWRAGQTQRTTQGPPWTGYAMFQLKFQCESRNVTHFW